MNELLTALQLTEEGYENIVFQQWFNWCSRHGRAHEDIQALICNGPLFKWWRMYYDKFEMEFLDEISPYQGQTTRRDAYLLYIKNVHKIQLYFSNPLIEKAKKTNITDEQK